GAADEIDRGVDGLDRDAGAEDAGEAGERIVTAAGVALASGGLDEEIDGEHASGEAAGGAHRARASAASSRGLEDVIERGARDAGRARRGEETRVGLRGEDLFVAGALDT